MVSNHPIRLILAEFNAGEPATGKARGINVSGIPECSPAEISPVALKNVWDTTIELKNIVSANGKIVIQSNVGIEEISAFFSLSFSDISDLNGNRKVNGQ